MDKSKVGSNNPKSATNREAKFSSIISSSGAVSMTKDSSAFEITSGATIGVTSIASGFAIGSLLISDELLMVGFSASLLISNCEPFFFKWMSSISSSTTANSSRL